MDMFRNKTNLNTLEAPPALAAVRRIVDGYKNFQVLRAGFACGLFDWLGDNGPADKATISSALKLRGAHLGGYLQALEDLGLLARHNGAYSLAPGLADILHATGDWNQAEALDRLLAPTSGWADLAAFLSEGWAPGTPAGPLPLALHPHLDEARRLSARLAARWAHGADGHAAQALLCFDGGDGLLAASLCQRLPDAHVTVVVLPDAEARVREVISDCGVSARCHVAPGTPLDPPLGKFDHAVIFHSLYAVRKFIDTALAAATARLAPGGELCNAHWFCLEACETAPGGLRDLDKAVLTDSHPLCHVETFHERMEKAGLIFEGRDDLAGEYGNLKLHFARRSVGAHACARDCGC